MGFITSNQGRPIQGVSQQPEKTRFPGQCTISDNLRPDIVRGLINRQGTELSAKLDTASLSSSTKWHFYSRGTGEKYLISIEETGKVRAWSLDGTEHIINVQDNAEAGYLANFAPYHNIKTKTIGDYTFLVNKTKPVLASTTLTPAISTNAIIYVQFMDYGQRIQIFIDSVLVAVYTSPNGSNADQKPRISPEYVIERLVWALFGASYGDTTGVKAGTTYGWWGIDISATYTIIIEGNIIHFSKKDGTDYNIRVTDTVDNANAVAIKGSIKNTTMLPGTATEGFIVEIDPPGASKTDNSNFYLKAVTNTGSNHVSWRETIQPEISVGLDKSTMPHVLVRESITAGVATFTLRQGEWSNREVGNENTNPHPTFVDEDSPLTIESIGLFQNRLFFTAGESVVMTRSADFFNFYRETTQAALETDPIDVFADVPKVHYLTSHVSFDGDLVFFSNSGQFLMDGSKPITRDNATLRQATSFEAETSVDPVASGDNVFFAFNYGQATGIREFFTDSVTDTKKARPVTDHVKQYLIGSPSLMKSSTNLNLLLIKTEQDNILYAYDWLWQGEQRVQSAWGRILFPEGNKILYYEFVEEFLWFVIVRDDESVYIEKIDMGDPCDAITGYPIRLDRKIEAIMTKAGEEWSVSNPFPSATFEDIVVIRKAGAYEAEIGTPIDIYEDAGYIKTNEDLGVGDVVVTIGFRYNCKYSPTNPVALDENQLALNLDRLTVGTYYVNYNTSGDVTATVEQDYGGVRVYEYSNRTLGGPENLVGFAPLVEGQHRIPIRQKSDRYKLTLETNSHLPLEIRDMEYNGNLNRRGRRL